MAAEGEAIIFYCCNLFIFFVLSSLMKDQPWDLNQTWSVGRKWCQFTNAFPRTFPQNFGRKKHQILGAKKRHILDDIFCDFRTRHRISPERNIAWTNKNASVIYTVSPTRWPTVCDPIQPTETLKIFAWEKFYWICSRWQYDVMWYHWFIPASCCFRD